jgi:type IV pilus assembly protein PilE
MRKRQVTGFTLIELMIVVVVIAVLAVIAVPNYMEQVRKGKRAEAARVLGDLQLRQERYRAEHPTYGNTTAADFASGNILGSVGAVTTFNAALKYYDVSATNNTATGYTLTATRKGDMASDPKCGNFTLTVDAGVVTKDVTAGDRNYCWRQ